MPVPTVTFQAWLTHGRIQNFELNSRAPQGTFNRLMWERELLKRIAFNTNFKNHTKMFTKKNEPY